MFSSLILAFREGLEGALVIGIILAYLIQIGRKDLKKFVFSGAATGVLVSLIGGFLGFKEAEELAEASEKIFEGIMMLISAGLVAYFIVWMGNQSKNISSKIKAKVKSNSNWIGLFLLSFLSVFREGMELVIFNLTKISQNASTLAVGSGLGILSAILVSYIIFKTSIKFNLKIIFKILGIILIFIGAEMFSEGILKFLSLDEEIFEKIFMAIFMIPSFYFFFNSELKKSIKKLSLHLISI